MKPGTRVRLVALPVELWAPWPDGALPAEEVAHRAGELATVIPGHDYLPDGCALLVVDANAASAEDDGDGSPTIYGFVVPVAALAVVEPEAASRASTLPDPWRPGAHEEERLAAGGALQRVVATASEIPSALSRASAEVPAGLGPAPGAAGVWRPVADYACSGEPTCVFARWLVPVQR